jgi:APA family basic amino acid/polyamine antiporter
LSQLLATKPLDLLLTEARDESGTGLRRVLGPVNLVTLGIGAIIGGVQALTPKRCPRLTASSISPLIS